MAQPPNFKFVDKLRPPCSKCGRPLLLTRIEPEEPGFDLRIYYCAGCGSNEAVIAPVGMVGISARLQDS
jgi:ribosomal protein S14